MLYNMYKIKIWKSLFPFLEKIAQVKELPDLITDDDSSFYSIMKNPKRDIDYYYVIRNNQVISENREDYQKGDLLVHIFDNSPFDISGPFITGIYAPREYIEKIETFINEAFVGNPLPNIGSKKIKENKMTIFDFADYINKTLEIRKMPRQKRWTCTIADSTISGISSVISSGFGEGRTPEESIKDYKNLISEKTLLFSIYSGSPKEFKVPKLE